MVSPAAIDVRYQTVTCAIRLPRCFQILFGVCRKSVTVDKVIVGVIWRVNVNDFDLAQIGLLEELEGVEVVAFDEEVLGGVEVDGLFADGTERFGDRCVGRECCGSLAWPVESVPFLGPFDDVI